MEKRLTARHRHWLTACLILILTAPVLAIGSYPLLRKDLKGARHINERSVVPLVLRDSSPATGPLRVLPSNPRYFTDGSGRAILLAGTHTWFTMQDMSEADPPLAFDYNAFLDFVQARGDNFFRTFVWEQSWKSWLDYDAHVSPNIYERTGPGNALDGHPKFDLTQFNQDYFDRIRERVIQAGNRGFYVSLMLFDDFSVHDKGYGYSPYPGHPYNPANNINGINGDPNKTGDGGQIHTLNISAITALQEAYVRKLIDTANDLDNILFEICNESEANQVNIDWQNHFIDYIHTYEAGKPKQHPVGFTVPWPDGNNADLFASNAEWISPNDSGMDTYKTDPPAADGRKVIITDTDHLWGLGGDRTWAWKSFTRGLNPIYMDPYDDYASWIWNGVLEPNDPSVVSLRANLGYILNYANRMNLAAMTPRGDLCSTGYCLANPITSGAEYLVYLPNGGSVNVNLSASPVDLSVEWFNPQNVTTVDALSVFGGNVQTFSAPFPGDAVLYIYNIDTSTPTETTTKTPTSLPSTQLPTSTIQSATQTSTSTPSSSTPTPPTLPLPCAQGLLITSVLFLAIVKSGYLKNNGGDGL